jgi:hypothetical protein
MGGLTKEQLKTEAKRLGVDIAGLSYHEAVSLVYRAKRRETEGDGTGEIPEDEKRYVEPRKAAPQLTNVSDVPDLRGKTIMVAPEMAATAVQLIKYDEKLNEKTPVYEERMAGELVNPNEDYNYKYASYKKTKELNKPNIAQSTLPKLNPGITFRPDKDLAPVITFQGQKGYAWHKIATGKLADGTVTYAAGIYDMLKDTFPEYLTNFKEANRLFYLGTTKLCADIPFTHSIFRKIEEREQEKAKLGLTHE